MTRIPVSLYGTVSHSEALTTQEAMPSEQIRKPQHIVGKEGRHLNSLALGLLLLLSVPLSCLMGMLFLNRAIEKTMILLKAMPMS